MVNDTILKTMILVKGSSHRGKSQSIKRLATTFKIVGVSTHFHKGGPKSTNGIDLRDVFAENMQGLIMKCLH